MYLQINKSTHVIKRIKLNIDLSVFFILIYLSNLANLILILTEFLNLSVKKLKFIKSK